MTRISPRVKIPPPPRPWIVRPTNLQSLSQNAAKQCNKQVRTYITMKLWARAAMREPRPNSRAAMRISYEVLALMNILEEGLERMSYWLPAESMA